MAKLMAEVISKVPDAQVMGDLDATVKWAAANGGDTEQGGHHRLLLGWPLTWLYTAHNPAVKAGVAWYGRLVGERPPLTPETPGGHGRHPERPGARPVRRRGHRHPP